MLSSCHWLIYFLVTKIFIVMAETRYPSLNIFILHNNEQHNVMKFYSCNSSGSSG